MWKMISNYSYTFVWKEGVLRGKQQERRNLSKINHLWLKKWRNMILSIRDFNKEPNSKFYEKWEWVTKYQY